jgi:hypothetical protein
MTVKRYGPPIGNPELGRESTHDLRALDAHITKWWGEPEVFHEIASDYVHIDLYIVPAASDRPYQSVITTGMSDRPMTVPDDAQDCRYAELVLALPPDWPITQEQLSDERAWWPFRHLKQTARFPHVYETFLWYGHTVANEDPPQPYAPGVPFCAAILSFPVLCPQEAWRLKVRDDKEVTFLAFLPIYDSELHFAWERGSDALFERLDDADVCELVQPSRPSVV